MGRKRTNPDLRFWAKVDVGDPDECWEWTGARVKRGYGKFRDGASRMVFAHRYSYSRFVGEIPEGMVVMHKCDNPPCVNPGHLKVGTMADNIADRDIKGRGVFPGRPKKSP